MYNMFLDQTVLTATLKFIELDVQLPHNTGVGLLEMLMIEFQAHSQ